MKVIQHELGRVSFLLPLEELIPLYGIVSGSFVDQVGERYKFKNVPPGQDALQFVFGDGIIQFSDMILPVIRLGLFADGILVEAKHTLVAQYFLNDFMSWGRETFGMRLPLSVPRQTYFSSVIVEFENIVEELTKFSERMSLACSRAIKEAYNVNLDVSFNRLAVSTDNSKMVDKMPEFVIERRVAVPFERNRFFCSGPLETKGLLGLLADLDATSEDG